MNSLTTTSTAGRRPPDLPRDQADLLASFKNALERDEAGKYSISSQRIPTPAMRQAMFSRLDELHAGLRPGEPAKIAERVARLFLRFPTMASMNDEKTKALVSAYVTDLSRFPLWAIDGAIKRILEGPARAFTPTAIELRDLVAQETALARTELDDVQKILAAEVRHDPTPEERARTLEEMRKLSKHLHDSADPLDRKGSRTPTKPEAQSWLDGHDKTAPLPQFSPLLRKHMGLPPIEGEPTHDA